MAAWIKRESTGWDEGDNDVKRAKLCLEHCSALIPDIGRPLEDPDSYVFVWSDKARRELNLREQTVSRFFDWKHIYDSVTGDGGKETFSGEPVFVGTYCSPVVVGYFGVYGGRMQPLRYVGQPSEYRVIEEPFSVCVAVRKETGSSLRVVHVETRKGKLDKAWVSGLAKQLKAKKKRMVKHDFLNEDARRSLLLKLRGVFAEHRLRIPRRYAGLIDDLWKYGYRRPSSGYVLALAIAINLCSN